MSQSVPEGDGGHGDQWWLSQQGTVTGPHSQAYIETALKTGAVPPQTYACPVGAQTWRRLSDCRAFASSMAGIMHDRDNYQRTPVAHESAGNPGVANMPLPLPDASSHGKAAAKGGPSQASDLGDTVERWQRLREIAKGQRLVNLATLISVLLYTTTFGSLLMIIVLVVPVFLLARPLRLARLIIVPLGLGFMGMVTRETEVLGAGALLLFIMVLYLNYRASAVLRAEGIRVGLFGTKLPDRPPAWFCSKDKNACQDT